MSEIISDAAGVREAVLSEGSAHERHLPVAETPLDETRPVGLGTTKVSVIIPTLNEALNLPHVLPAIPRWVHELIIVDGRSTDNTVDVARSLWPSVRVVLQHGRGKGDALACGFGAARGDVIVMLDADGSTDPLEIGRFVQPLIDGADFVKGSRRLKGAGSEDISRLRGLGNIALTWTVNVLFNQRFTDLCYGYNAFWKRCLPALQVDCAGFEVETLMNVRAARSGLAVEEVPSIERERLHGASNLNAVRDGCRVLRTIIRERAALFALPSRDAWSAPLFTEVSHPLDALSESILTQLGH